MSFSFANYDVAELIRCGQEFEKGFAGAGLYGNTQWTPKVIDWFQRAAAPGIRVYPPVGQAVKGQFLVDLCHASFPLDQPDDGPWPSTTWYERAFSSTCEMKLVLESEWGKWDYADQSFVMMLDDAFKLAVIRASVKVIVFSSDRRDAPGRAIDALQKLRSCTGDTAPWLWIDVPNDPNWTAGQPRVIRHGTLS